MKTFILLAGALILLASCAPNTLSGSPLDTTTPQAPVAVTPAPPCPAGMKLCAGTCTTGCCVDTDCTLGMTCQNGTCVTPPRTCGFLEQWNTTANDCTCTTGNKWCRDQGKCIPAKACCGQADCPIFGDVCGESVILTSICITEDATNCKQIREGATETYELATTHTVRVNRVLETGVIDARIDDTDARNLTTRGTHRIGNVTLRVDKITVNSGECRSKR